MTDVQALALGHRWLSANGSGKAGMLVRSGDKARRLEEDTWLSGAWWPDFRDGATCGAARAALEERCRYVVWVEYQHRKDKGDTPSYEVFADDGDYACSFLGAGETEGEALVAAMEGVRND